MEQKSLLSGPSEREVHYLRGGSGEPLLFLHHFLGLAVSEAALTRLAASFDVIAPYVPGFGPAKDQLTEFDDGPLDLVLHFGDFLDALSIPEAHVAGIGIGAWMAAEIAAITPARVKRLVLINPLGLWRDDIAGEDPFAQHPGFPSRVLFAARDGRETLWLAGRDKMDAHVEELLNLRAGARFLWPIPDTGIHKRLPRISAPSLVVTSEEDVVVPAAYGPLWQESIDGAQLASLPGAGHVAELDQPDATARLISEFMAHGSIAAVA